MTGRPRSVTDDDIFTAVAATITTLGPAGLTLAAVASSAGLSAPALTQRFGSKHGLLVAFAKRASTSVSDLFATAQSNCNDPLEIIVTSLTALPSGITTRESMANNLAFLQMDLIDPELRPHAVAQSRALRAEIAEWVAKSVHAGHLLPSTAAEVVAADLYAVYSGAMLTWAIDGEGDLAGWIRRHLERAIAPHRSQPKRRKKIARLP